MLNSLKTAGLLGLLSGLLLWIGSYWGGTGLWIALVLAIGMNGFSWFYSDKLAIKMARAQQVDASSAPRLHAMVEELAAAAGEPMPRLFVSPSPQLNAFASGRNPKHAVVCVNKGLLDTLTEREVRGVIGHELQHVYNRDILIGSVAAMIGTAITYLATVARWGMIFGGGGRDRDGGNVLGQLAMIILAPIAAMLIQAAVTRSRESRADHTGAELTQDPVGLARALNKLERGSNDANRLRAGGTPIETNPNFNHLFITAPFGGRLLPMKLFSSHPPIPDRIKALEPVARELGQVGPDESIFDHLAG
ncbi:zinc metalloprotease HtpX [Salsipaludibacter albus]|uniref:zinc metalloprotease HtpX n=1 Tax=Salsipaludibacter albus TaxID=2849650 RepID=UPI001EE4971E|nr:zinc metalloprotease HtpX [Salsipaludibacter albus]MBY5161018.1 zinc metalloprotease HtpX [Salsipaludibacter albus]